MATETIETVESLREKLASANSHNYDLASFREDLERVVGTQHLGRELRDVMFARAGRNEMNWDVVLGRYLDLVKDLGILAIPVFAKARRSVFLADLQHVLNVHQVVLSGDRGGNILAAPRNGEEFDVEVELQSDGVIRTSVG